ncbi:MAG: AraC family transcriptional regulator [Lentisphaeria bacterium]|nr:AraC family transcriptional regulator [Lentisphaeria bacterium]
MSRDAKGKGTPIAYTTVKVSMDPASRFAGFKPRENFGRPLFLAGIQYMGVNRLEKEFMGGTDCCETHLLHVTIEGELECRAGKKPLYIGPGDMLMAPARGPHWLRLAKAPATVVWFHLWQKPCWEFLLDVERHVQKVLNPTMLLQAAQAILYCAQGEDPLAGKLMTHYAEILLLCLSRELDLLQNPTERALQQRLQHVFNTVREHPAHSWSLDELARRMSLSPHSLSRLCKKHTGVTPMRKVAMIRMSIAEQLLQGTDLTLADIASRVGYKTEYAFSDAFMRVTAQRPGATRRI